MKDNKEVDVPEFELHECTSVNISDIKNRDRNAPIKDKNGNTVSTLGELAEKANMLKCLGEY